MTRESLVTVTTGVAPDEARRLLHRHRIEKLLVVDDAYRCVGLITVKDMDKAETHPLANKDELGRLRVAAATGVGPEGHARSRALIEAEVDVIVVDTAHGHSRGVLDAVAAIKKFSNSVQVIAGNVATPEGALALIEAGADGGEDRHRPRFHLHHPRRRRRRRAAVHRGAGMRRRLPRGRCPGHRRWRHAHLGRHREGDRRRGGRGDDRLAARRHRRSTGRGVPLPGPVLQVVSRHGQHRRDGARVGGPLFPAGHQGPVEARAGRR